MERYEEDCDWAIPFFFHRHLFCRRTQQYAIQSLANYHWQAFEKATGITLLPGESYAKAKHTEYQAHQGREFVTSAYGDWCYDVPAGKVYVETQIAGTQKKDVRFANSEDQGKSYLVDEANYKKKSGNCYHWIDEQYTPFHRNKAYYRWEDYNTANPQPRPELVARNQVAT